MAKRSLVGQVVQMTWEDAWANDGYWNDEEFKSSRPYIIEQYGLVVQDDASGITTTAERMPKDARGQYRHVHHVPRGMIRKIRVLK